MKRIFTFFLLLVVVVFEANATTLDPDDKIFMTLSSYNATGQGGSVTVKIDKDFTAVVTIPETDAPLYGDTVKMDVVLQNIETLGITGTKTYSKTIASGTSGVEVYLSDIITETYAFTGTKEFTVKIADLEKITFEVTREAGSFTYTIKPKTEADKTLCYSALDLMKNYVTTSPFEEGNPKFSLAGGSYIINDNECLGFKDNFEFYSFGGIRSTLQSFTDEAELSTVDYTKKTTAALAPGSYVVLGDNVFTFNENDTTYVTLDDAAHDVYIPDFLSNVMVDVAAVLSTANDTFMKFMLINDVCNYLGFVDKYFIAKDNLEVSVRFTNDAPDGIDNVAADMPAASNSAVYTLGGCRVSNMRQHGVYIVNGKKLLK